METSACIKNVLQKKEKQIKRKLTELVDKDGSEFPREGLFRIRTRLETGSSRIGENGS